MSPAEARSDLSQSLLLEALQQISALSTQVSNLQGQANIIIREQERAAERRKEMYDRMRSLEQAAAAVARIEPLVDIHERNHQRGVGAIWLARGAWAVSAGSIGAAATWVLQALTGKHP